MPCRDEFAQPGGCLFVYLVVISCHSISLVLPLVESSPALLRTANEALLYTNYLLATRGIVASTLGAQKYSSAGWCGWNRVRSTDIPRSIRQSRQISQ